MRVFEKKVCLQCGETYTPTGSSSKFCTHECRTKYYRVHKDKQYRDKYNAKHGVAVGIGSGGHTGFGEKNHMYTHGLCAFRNYGRRLKISGATCNRCGKDLTYAKRGEWCGHHIDHDRTNNSIENFELLCKSCHQIHHDAARFLPHFGKVQRLSGNGVDVTSIEAPNSCPQDDDIV